MPVGFGGKKGNWVKLMVFGKILIYEKVIFIVSNFMKNILIQLKRA